MKDLLIATHNVGKARELSHFLAGAPAPVRVLSLADAGLTQEVPEEGDTFATNAIAKAVEYSRLAGRNSGVSHEPIRWPDLLTLADDSGLEVDALGGAPGVRSARYGGPDFSDEQRCDQLLREVSQIPWAERKARFVCVLALAQGGKLIRCFEGKVEGLIALEPRGTNGFGYDPIFYFPPLDRTFAELSRERKEEVSHRGQALRQFRKYLAKEL